MKHARNCLRAKVELDNSCALPAPVERRTLRKIDSSTALVLHSLIKIKRVARRSNAVHAGGMRLRTLTTGLPVRTRFALRIARLWLSDGTLDVARTLMYRPEFFGKSFCIAGEALMRGPSDWSVGERELMGAFTSRLNDCEY